MTRKQQKNKSTSVCSIRHTINVRQVSIFCSILIFDFCHKTKFETALFFLFSNFIMRSDWTQATQREESSYETWKDWSAQHTNLKRLFIYFSKRMLELNRQIGNYRTRLSALLHHAKFIGIKLQRSFIWYSATFM